MKKKYLSRILVITMVSGILCACGITDNSKTTSTNKDTVTEQTPTKEAEVTKAPEVTEEPQATQEPQTVESTQEPQTVESGEESGQETSVNDPYDLYSWDEGTNSYIPYQQAGSDGSAIGQGNGWYYYNQESGSYLPW